MHRIFIPVVLFTIGGYLLGNWIIANEEEFHLKGAFVHSVLDGNKGVL